MAKMVVLDLDRVLEAEDAADIKAVGEDRWHERTTGRRLYLIESFP